MLVLPSAPHRQHHLGAGFGAKSLGKDWRWDSAAMCSADVCSDAHSALLKSSMVDVSLFHSMFLRVAGRVV